MELTLKGKTPKRDLCNRCQNGTLTPEHAFSCNIAKKVRNFGFMTLEKADLKPIQRQPQNLLSSSMAEFYSWTRQSVSQSVSQSEWCIW